MNPKPSDLAVIVPVFNEEAGVGAVLDGILSLPGSEAWTVIVVDDGSTDATAERLHAFEDRIRVVRHTSRRGYGAALKSGLLAARTRNVLFIDGDGQHDPADIPRFVEALASYECVFSVRPPGAGIPAVRRPGKWVLRHVCNFLAHQRIPDINSGFRAGRRRIFMSMLDLLPDGYSFSTTSLLYVLNSRFSHVFLPIACRFREGTSSVNIVSDGVKTLFLGLRLIMLFDPFRAFLYPSFALIGAGVAYQCWIFARYGLHIEGGFVFSVLAGIILFHFGLLGDQVASLRKEISSHNNLFWERHEDEERGGRPGA